MSRLWSRVHRVVAWLAILFIAGCAHLSGADPQNRLQGPLWEGRLLVKVEGDAPQSWSAAFTLQGSAQAGQLSLYTPLGTTLAQVTWDASGAQLQSADTTRRFASLAELTQELSGTELPVASLFAWLQGVNAPAAGWTADLSDLPQGRLRAQRITPPAPAQLLVVLER